MALLILVVLTGALTYLLRSLAVPILALLLLIYYELIVQTQLLRQVIRQHEAQTAMASRPPSESDQEEPAEDVVETDVEEAEQGPGYHLKEPEYILQDMEGEDDTKRESGAGNE